MVWFAVGILVGIEGIDQDRDGIAYMKGIVDIVEEDAIVLVANLQHSHFLENVPSRYYCILYIVPTQLVEIRKISVLEMP